MLSPTKRFLHEENTKTQNFRCWFGEELVITQIMKYFTFYPALSQVNVSMPTASTVT